MASSAATKTSIHPQMIRPAIDLTQLSTYLVNVGIGTFDANFNSPEVYYLHRDTGSELAWTQCEECLSPGHHCFPQKDPPFPNTKSKSYQHLPCKGHPLCLPNQCIGDSCSINMAFMDEIAFVCTIDSTNMDYGGEENLPDDGHDFNTYLRFGEDIPKEIAGSQTTTLLHLKDWKVYYRLWFYFYAPHYNELISNLEEHFSGSSNLNRMEGAFDICYLRLVPEGYDGLPNMTFHLRNNANLEIGPEQIFYVGKQLPSWTEFFC
ncbi:hypothetical protein FH972_006020 [Carpinus fangiana]|uniref:Xylanase inhibitor N-terminal domain-containing protein n=1 Tax=Carpinus fangiana TaxID=176857 RepID=A0A5N6QUI9_9ROSI|nr:hypothetical protein FH972_006020 [Carpinus fangiana]